MIYNIWFQDVASRYREAKVTYIQESYGEFEVYSKHSIPLTAVVFFASYTRRISNIFANIKWPEDVLMLTVTVLAECMQQSDLSAVNLRTFWRNASPTRNVSCRTLKQWNNNSPKFHFRLKEGMLDYYHDVQYLMQGRGSPSYTG